MVAPPPLALWYVLTTSRSILPSFISGATAMQSTIAVQFATGKSLCWGPTACQLFSRG